MSKLQTTFMKHFEGQPVISTQEIYDWYCAVKSNPENLPYRSAIHYLIINPLLHKRVLQKVSNGLYTLGKMSEEEIENLDSCESPDVELPELTERSEAEDWEKYIQQKLQGA